MSDPPSPPPSPAPARAGPARATRGMLMPAGDDMDLEELRAFLAVADTGSMLAAADRLGLPRTTLRRRVEALEARIGSPLFFRGTAGAVLSPVGVTVAAGGRRVLQEASALLSSVRGQGDTAEGVVHIVLPVGLPPQLIVPAFAAVRRDHPRLTFDVRFREDPLSELGADLVVHFGDRVQSGPWVTRTLLSVPEQLLATPAYLEARGTPSTLEELAGHEIFTWHRPGAEATALPLLAGGTVPIEPVLVTSEIHAVRQVVLAGLGMAFLPDAGLPDPGDPAPLVPVLPALVGRTCPVNVVVPEALARSPQVRAVQQSILAILP